MGTPVSRVDYLGQGRRYWYGWPKDYKRDGTLPGIIMASGRNPGLASSQGGAMDPGATGTIRKIAMTLASRWPVLCFDQTAQQFGNATAQAEYATAIALLRQAPTVANGLKGAGAAAVGLGALGVSQDFAGFMRYHRGTAALNCLVGIIPMYDLADLRNFDRGGLRDAINTAWGLAAGSTGDYPLHGTSLAALPTGANPANPASNPPLDLPIYMCYSDEDIICPPTTHKDAAVAAMGANVTTYDVGTAGHDYPAYDGVDLAALLAFVDTYM